MATFLSRVNLTQYREWRTLTNVPNLNLMTVIKIRPDVLTGLDDLSVDAWPDMATGSLMILTKLAGIVSLVRQIIVTGEEYVPLMKATSRCVAARATTMANNVK
jgi:hypothetical protein